ncbi:MAG: phospho-N-acetylmuramoyl-pentapeptide-transferase [Clostridia bacterium]|nr:phospho-N-acetylmuramoyl-pentapeptide-transferase [Clostridia bacterium]
MEWILMTAGLSFVLAVLVAPFAIKKLRELKFGQKILEDGPTWHMNKQGTPTMGGVIFIAGMLVAVLCKLPWMIANQDYRALVMLGLSLVFAGVGVIDDWTKIKKKKNQGITPKQKLALQMAAAVLFVSVMRVMGYLDSSLYIPFTGISLNIPFPVYVLISIFIIIGADNAVNITDGIDGLCASVTLVVSVFFSVLFLQANNNASIFSLALCGGLFAFFLFNKNPAKVFMGDTGSLFLGGAVCAMAYAHGMPLILVLVGIVYIIETMSDIIQVLYFKATGGKRFFKMAPIHHHFEKCGWSEWKIVIVASALTAAMCLLAYFA